MYKSDLRKINKYKQKMNTESILTAWLGARIMYPCRETCLPVDYCLRRVWRRTDNAMAKRKFTKGQTTIF